MKPEYQRRSEVWSRWKRAHLIDSILNDFDVPKFYVADFTTSKSGLNKNKKPYAIIDGKQRFETIFAFFAGELTLNNSTELASDRALKIGGLSYSELKAKFPRLASKIEEFEPVVMSVVTNQMGMIEQLFVRLNSGEPANAAERRNAMPGPVPNMIRELITHPFFQTRIRFNTKRMQEFNLAAKLLLIEYRGGFVDTKARDIDQFVLSGAQASNKALKAYHDAEERALQNLEALSLAFEPSDKLLSSQGHIPVYYWVLRNNQRYQGLLRPFLVEFSNQVIENVRLSRVDPDKADAELLTYYTQGRTTNDQGSLKDRYAILLKRLKKYARDS
jgi:hypothetical protein